MLSRKRTHALFSADYSDDESGSTSVQVHEEQMTYQRDRARKRVLLSDLPSSERKQDRIATHQVLRAVTVNDNVAPDSSFFSYTTHEIVEEDGQNCAENDLDIFESDSSESDDETEETSPPKPRHKSLDDFRELRTEFLEQFLRRFCPTSVSRYCDICETEGASILCLDCFIFKSRCQNCIVEEHRHHPLHRIQYFDGGAWQRTTLRELGLKVNLCHQSKQCPVSVGEDKRIVVIDIKGIQEINVSFCKCNNLFGVDATERSQLISHGLYPATTEHPGTVATFSTLDAFEILSGEGKISGYHFYKSLVRLRDGPGYENLPRRYEEFMRMTREYQHLKMLLRAGKMPNSDGILDVADGELAVECPACPHPKRNIPEDWDKKVDSWIYTLFVMIDANFRLKSKKKRSSNDLDLGGGSSYFVREEPYKEHLRKTVQEKEIKYCDSGLRAVDHANLKGGAGYNASGVVGVQCRHMLLRRNGVGDLQKGEKYANVDYVVLSSLKGTSLRHIIMSYDIACQYNRNFTSRMLKFDEHMQLDLDKVKLGFVIPQFHIAGHGEKCRTRYNLRYREHVGRTDGENIERGWAYLNPLSMASKEMGSGARHDYLEWHMGDWNYQRIVSFGPLFTRKLVEAVRESVKHSTVLSELRRAFPAGIVKEIEDQIRKWDEDPGRNYDPFAEPTHGKSFLKVHKLLTDAEANEHTSGILCSESLSATHWLTIGLELEDTQCSVRKLFKKNGRETTALGTSAMEKNTMALRKIYIWKTKQLFHMPALSEFPQWDPMTDMEGSSRRCWRIKLNLPSSVPSQHRRSVCPDALINKEYKLRIAQAFDCLMEIRRLTQKQWWLSKKKRQHVSGPGQKINAKSIGTIQVVVEQRDIVVARYRRTREALTSLQPNGNWQGHFKALEDDDIRHYEDDQVKGEGRRSPSWIWTLKAEGEPSDENEDAAYEELKVEYAKSRARAQRWFEEAQLLKEEMRRVLCYFNWRIGWWIDRNSSFKDRKDEAALGSIVYGNTQVRYLQKLAAKFKKQWESECNINDFPEIRNDKVLVVKSVNQLPVFEDEGSVGDNTF